MNVVELLAFERLWAGRPSHDGGKEQAIRDRFGVGPTRYHQALNAVLDTVEALEVDAVTTRRLQRVCAAGRRARRDVNVEPVG